MQQYLHILVGIYLHELEVFHVYGYKTFRYNICLHPGILILYDRVLYVRSLGTPP